MVVCSIKCFSTLLENLPDISFQRHRSINGPILSINVATNLVFQIFQIFQEYNALLDNSYDPFNGN